LTVSRKLPDYDWRFLKETVQDRKNGACWWKKRPGIGNAQM